MCVGVGVIKNTAVYCLTARKSPQNGSLPLGIVIHIIGMMPRKSGESSVYILHFASAQSHKLTCIAIFYSAPGMCSKNSSYRCSMYCLFLYFSGTCT